MRITWATKGSCVRATQRATRHHLSFSMNMPPSCTLHTRIEYVYTVYIVQNAHDSNHGTSRHSSLLDLLRSAFSLSLSLARSLPRSFSRYSSLVCPLILYLAAPLELAHWIWAETTEWHKPKSRMFSGHLFYWFLCILFDLIKLWTTISDVCASSNCSAQFKMETHTRAAPFIHSSNAHTDANCNNRLQMSLLLLPKCLYIATPARISIALFLFRITTTAALFIPFTTPFIFR